MEEFALTTALIRLPRGGAASRPRVVVRKRLFYLLSLLAIALPWRCLAGYVPPVGIPTPPFGIDQTVSMYASATYDFGKGPVSYPDAGNGPYTHYVDNKAAGATDTNNTYGTPTKPRLTIPKTLAPGSVVEVHGGPYDGNLTLGTTGVQGTVTRPIFIRGYSVASKPIIKNLTSDTNFIKGCTYLIIENIDFTNAHLEIRQTSNHVGVRFCDFHGVPAPVPPALGTSVIHFWSDSAGLPSQYEDEIVFYQNRVYENGYPAANENGVQGVMIANGARNIWILENQIYNNGEDNIQVYWMAGRVAGSAEKIYIGGNTIYDDSGKMENAVDIKQSNDVIVSSNDCYGYRSTFASDGTAIVLNNDDPSNNLWIINNHIHNSTIGIRNQSPNNVYVVGNLIEEIHHEAGQTYTGLVAQGTGFFNSVGAYSTHPEYTKTAHVVNNTFYHTDQGVILNNATQYYVENNIVSELNYKDGSVWHIGRNNGAWTVKNNLLFQTGTTPIIRQASSIYYSATSFDKARLGSGDLAADPLFVSPGTNFNLLADSPAKDAGTTADVYATFQSLYGVSLAKDKSGTERPVGPWDIGAYEFGTDSELPPEPPANLHIITPP